jgi:hypothetical protein
VPFVARDVNFRNVPEALASKGANTHTRFVLTPSASEDLLGDGLENKRGFILDFAGRVPRLTDVFQPITSQS